MRKTLLLIAAIFCATTNTFATIHTVNVAIGAFTPANFAANVGDTVRWVWVSGDHTTTSSVIPGGAASWDRIMNAANTTYMYKITVPGTYGYVCTPHASMGMVASFTATNPANIPPVNTNGQAITILPNPVSGSLRVYVSDPSMPVSVILTDLNGREVLRKGYIGQKELSIDISSIPDALYVMHAIQNNTVITEKLIINH
ncbi:MAG: hypothetical protein K0Q79_497 [Flavipsychrobacter sp.]|nr:hypothetical protein [Flavipsychrobacter sp.]